MLNNATSTCKYDNNCHGESLSCNYRLKGVLDELKSVILVLSLASSNQRLLSTRNENNFKDSVPLNVTVKGQKK